MTLERDLLGVSKSHGYLGQECFRRVWNIMRKGKSGKNEGLKPLERCDF